METSMDGTVLAQECAKQAFMRAKNTDVKFLVYCFVYYPFAFAREFGMALCDVTVQGFAVFVFICRSIPVALRYSQGIYHPFLTSRGFRTSDIYHFDTASEILAVGIAVLFVIYWMAVIRRNMANNRLLPAFMTTMAWIAGLGGIPVALEVGWRLFDPRKTIAENCAKVQYTRGCLSFAFWLNRLLEHGLYMYALLVITMLFIYLKIEWQRLYDKAIGTAVIDIKMLMLGGPKDWDQLPLVDVALGENLLQLASPAAISVAKKEEP